MSGCSAAAPHRVLFISLEFLGPIFSGNGVYARSLVRALKLRGAHVLVLSGRAKHVEMQMQDEEVQVALRPPHSIIDVPLATWGTLDRRCDWRGLAEGVRVPERANQISNFDPSVICAVDWSSLPAYSTLIDVCGERFSQVPLICMNFRVFTMSRELHSTEGDSRFYALMESAATRIATVSVALCKQDATSLGALALGVDPNAGAALMHGSSTATHEVDEEVFRALGDRLRWFDPCVSHCVLPDIRVLLPPLRRDVEVLAHRFHNGRDDSGGSQDFGGANETSSAKRNLISSVVRLSPEKRAHVFADLIVGLLGARSLTSDVENPMNDDASRMPRYRPFVAGSRPDAAYAQLIINAITQVSHDAEIPDGFLGAQELAEAYSRTLLNVHPSIVDAYGMTIVEAAAFGAPSLVHVPSAALIVRPGSDRLQPSNGSGSAVTFKRMPVASRQDAHERASETESHECDRALSCPGYLRMLWRSHTDMQGLPLAPTEVSLDDALLLGADVAGMALPPVGACDLLLHVPIVDPLVSGPRSPRCAALHACGEPFLAGSSDAARNDVHGNSDIERYIGGDDDTSYGVIPMDLTAPMDKIIENVSALVNTAAGRATLVEVGAHARAAALSWTEDSSADALAQLIKEVSGC